VAAEERKDEGGGHMKETKINVEEAVGEYPLNNKVQ